MTPTLRLLGISADRPPLARRPSDFGPPSAAKPRPPRPRDDVGIFRSVVALQDQGMPVSESYRLVAGRHRLSAGQVRAIVDVGVNLGWVDEFCAMT